MEQDKTFFIVYYSNKDKKHITRRGKHDDKSRYGTSKKVLRIMSIMIWTQV